MNSSLPTQARDVAIGRDNERERLIEMARGVLSSGRGAVVVMEGHPGTSMCGVGQRAFFLAAKGMRALVCLCG